MGYLVTYNRGYRGTVCVLFPMNGFERGLKKTFLADGRRDLPSKQILR